MGDIIPWLFGVTLIIVLALGIWQYFRTRKAQETNSPAVHATRRDDGTVSPEQRAERH